MNASPQSEKSYISSSTQSRKHVRKRIVLISKIEQLTKQKLFPSYKLNLEEKSTGGANENASPK